MFGEVNLGGQDVENVNPMHGSYLKDA